MRAGSLGRTISVLILLLAAVVMVAAIPMSAAQTGDTPSGQAPATRVQDTRDDGYGQWGWLGLIGLLGLAGLMRRGRAYPANRAADRPAERIGRS